MKTIKEKIDFIYEKISKKDLTFGCKLEVNWKEMILIKQEISNPYSYYECYNKETEMVIHEPSYTKIIWHPVMFWDIAEYFYSDEKIADLSLIFEDLRKPIEEQEEWCIEYIYHILMKK